MHESRSNETQEAVSSQMPDHQFKVVPSSDRMILRNELVPGFCQIVRRTFIPSWQISAG